MIEVLVSLMLLSLLAAAVFPVVTQRVGRGEPHRALQELRRIQSGIEAFGRDMEGEYPGDLEDLASPLSHRDRTFRGLNWGDHDAESGSRRWNGPYFEAAVAEGGSVTTGFGVPIRDDFIPFDDRKNAPSGSPRFQPEGATSFVAVQIGSAGRQLTASQFEAINDLVDGAEEPDGPGDSTSWTSGRLRFDNSLVEADSIAYYLVAEIQR